MPHSQFLFQQIVSVVGVMVLIALAWWAKIPRKLEPLDEARARGLLADEFPKAKVEAVWLAADGQGAIARAGDEGLILTALGDGYVARAAPWSELAGATLKDGKLSIRIKDFAAPRVTVAMPAWPPQEVRA